MAARKRKKSESRSPYFCSYCDMNFDYQSKFLRHMSTEGHKRFASVCREDCDRVNDWCDNDC